MSHMTIGKKLMLAFAAMLVLTLGLAYSSLTSIGGLSARLNEIGTKTALKVELSGQIQTAVAMMRAAVRSTVLATALKDTSELEESRRTFQDQVTTVQKVIGQLRPLLVTERGRQDMDKVETGLTTWVSLQQQMVQLCVAGDIQQADQLRKGKQKAVATDMSNAASDVVQINKGLLAAAVTDGAEAGSRSRWIASVLIGVCLLVGVAVVLLVRQISNTLRHVAAEMADGAEQVASASGQVSSSSQALAQGASEQAASLEETSASTEEIHSMTQKNAANSKSAADFMSEAATKVDEANRMLDLMVTSMKEINTSSDKVAKIIKVIDEIAFQTNILALNAAVEAARAGEAGMGFAVVADEVRNLAQRCAQAAKDTAGLIEESIVKSNDGKTKLDQVAGAIHSITESSNNVKTLVDEVNLGSQEQARGIEQIAKAVSQMEQVTQKTAASAEQGASASEELSAQAETMRTIVGQLQAMVGGGSQAAGQNPTLQHKRVASPRQALRWDTPASPKHSSHHDEPALAGVHLDENAFPMEDDSKKF